MDPDVAQLLSELAAVGYSPLAGMDVDRAREQFREVAAQLARGAETEGPIADVIPSEVTIRAADTQLAARVYRPRDVDESIPTVLYLHGGGHVLGDLDTHDWHARAIAADTASVVVSVDYRRAPEHRWPIAANDARAAFTWVAENAGSLGGDEDRVGIVGDSAGANLSAVVLSHLRDEQRSAKAALLLYPATDFSLARDYPSRVEFGSSGYLTLTEMGWFGRLYAGKGAPVDHPDLSPIMADVSHFPTTIVAVAELDPLRDEGVALAAKLADSSGDVVLLELAGMPHGFYDFAQRSAAARVAVKQCHTDFARHLST